MFLSTELSAWLIIPSLLVAITGAWILYRNHKFEFTDRFSRWLDKLLLFIRFAGLFILCLLILGPLFKWISSKTEKPYIILALDNSQSVLAVKDSAKVRQAIVKWRDELTEELESDFEVRTFLFGKKMSAGIQPDFNDKQTDIANVFKEINQTFDWRNTGAVVLATDGIYNEGSNPLYAAADLRSPVYAVALGDTVQQRDIIIQQVRHNQLVYAGNIFPLSIDLRAFGYQGAAATLNVKHNEQVIHSKVINIDRRQFFNTIQLDVEAGKEGTQHYIITVTPLRGEASIANNRYDVFVQVINGKQKIKIVALASHPDIAALRNSITDNENYEVSVQFVNQNEAINLTKDISLMVLHQLPGPRGEGAMLMRQINDQKIPVWYILGSQTNLSIWNQIENGLVIESGRMGSNDAQPIVQNTFASFILSTEDAERISKFPPLLTPFGNYIIRSEADVLLKQQIGYVKTDYPLWFFTRSEGVRKGFVCGEGIWKWRLWDYQQSKQQTFNALIGKTVQYLAVKDDKGRFRVNHHKRFSEAESVIFDAEVYNESFELINTSDVQMVITDSRDKQFQYTFSKNGKGYQLNAGLMPPGSYSFIAKTLAGNKNETVKGQFVVAPLQVEFLQTTADHQLLRELSSQSGAALFYLTEPKQLAKAIRDNENIKPVVYKQEEIKSWINLNWIFFLIIALFGVEWFIRKWNGAI